MPQGRRIKEIMSAPYTYTFTTGDIITDDLALFSPNFTSWTYNFLEPNITDLIDEGLNLASQCLKKKQYDLFDRVTICVEKMINLAKNNL